MEQQVIVDSITYIMRKMPEIGESTLKSYGFPDDCIDNCTHIVEQRRNILESLNNIIENFDEIIENIPDDEND